jgi:serine/arginine repetitive matrix protein 1
MSAALKTGGDARALRTTKFPDIFNKKVDMTKVNLAVIKKWISDEATKILKNDDDVVIETIFNELEPKFVRPPRQFARRRPLTTLLVAQHQRHSSIHSRVL